MTDYRHPKANRVCPTCGKSFYGANKRCQPCVNVSLTKARICPCGAEYIGYQAKCLECRRPKKIKKCLDCDTVINARKNRCDTCKAIHLVGTKTCKVCGNTFKNNQLCPKCVNKARTQLRICLDCGKEYKGILHSGQSQCNSCYRPVEHKQRAIENQQKRRETTRSTCRSCLETFRGQGTQCSRCANRERFQDRVCEQCGKSFHRDLYKGRALCASCRLTPEQWEARIERVKRRSVLKRGASEAEYNLSWRSLWALGIRHCAYCGVECDPEDNRYGHIGPTYPTLDHVTPLVLGGAHASSNSVLSCFTCNARKGSRILVAEGL